MSSLDTRQRRETAVLSSLTLTVNGALYSPLNFSTMKTWVSSHVKPRFSGGLPGLETLVAFIEDTA